MTHTYSEKDILEVLEGTGIISQKRAEIKQVMSILAGAITEEDAEREVRHVRRGRVKMKNYLQAWMSNGIRFCVCVEFVDGPFSRKAAFHILVHFQFFPLETLADGLPRHLVREVRAELPRIVSEVVGVIPRLKDEVEFWQKVAREEK